MTKKAESKKQDKAEVVQAFTEFSIGGQVVPVVESLDELPRSSRRLLRNVAKDAQLSVAIVGAPQFEAFERYALAYARTQGISVNLDAIEDEDEYDRVRQEAVIAGGNLMGHFAQAAAAGDEGKASDEGEAKSEA